MPWSQYGTLKRLGEFYRRYRDWETNTTIEKVNNIGEVILISGNHDRVTSNNHEDVTGEVVHWVHYVLKSRFGNNMTVSWDYDVANRLS